MSKIFNIIFRPSKTISIIADEEPVFSSLFIFTISVLIGNISLVKDFFINGRVLIFNSLALVFLWGGAMVIVDLILAGILMLISQSSSKILNLERFRKLIIVQLNVSIILILKPLIDIFTSSILSWIIIFILASVLMLITVVSLWDTTEIKAALSIGIAVVIVFSGIKALKPSEYLYSKDFFVLNELIRENLKEEKAGLLGFKDFKFGKENLIEIIQAVDKFAEEKPDSKILPYCILIKAKALLLINKSTEAVVLFRRLITLKGVPLNVYRTAAMNLYQFIPEKEFLLLPLDDSVSKWRKIFELWRIPVKISSYRDSINRICSVRMIIQNENLSEVEKHMDVIINNFSNSDFEDDIYFWIGARYEREGNLNAALKYYKNSINLSVVDIEKIKIESAIRYIEERMGIDILEEKLQPPYAMAKAARIYEILGRKKEANNLYLKLIKDYPGHSLAEKALVELALNKEEKGKFKEAVELYRRLLNNYPLGSLKHKVLHKKNIIEKNLGDKELLSLYSSAWRKWQTGKYSKAIKLYKKLIDDFPESEMAWELQYNIAQYFRKNGKYMDAIREFRTGYKRFKNSPRGFDFGWQIGNCLSDDLHYYLSALEWYEEMKGDYSKEYIAPVSGITAIDIAWKSAAICKKYLRDYSKAKQIYAEIIESYSNNEIVAKALFESAQIDEEKYHKYSQATSQYNTIISKYPDTLWKEKARKRLESIYNRGLKLLEKYH